MSLTKIIQNLDRSLRDTNGKFLHSDNYPPGTAKKVKEINSILASQLSSMYGVTVTNDEMDNSISNYGNKMIIGCNFGIGLPRFNLTYMLSVILNERGNPIFECSMDAYGSNSFLTLATIDNFKIEIGKGDNIIHILTEEFMMLLVDEYISTCWTAKVLVDLLDDHGKQINGYDERIKKHKHMQNRLQELIVKILSGKALMKFFSIPVPPVSKPDGWKLDPTITRMLSVDQ